MKKVRDTTLVKRAARQVYRTFKLNRSELEMLASIGTFLMLTGKETAGMRRLISFSYVNILYPDKEIAIFKSLERKGMIEGIKKGRGLGYYISPLGIMALNEFEDHLNDVDKWVKKQGKGTEIKSPVRVTFE